MINNFSGVTFPYQNVTPTDDSVVRRAAFPDGILYGCALSYVGTTLTMAEGQLMICGRQIRHVAATNWPIIDKKSGYARILLTIDLTKAASEEVFEQISACIEYADDFSGFAEPVQEAIYAEGKIYQYVLCTVSLAEGGISGIATHPIIATSDHTVLICEDMKSTAEIYFDTSQFRFYWVLASHFALNGLATALQSCFIVSDTSLSQIIQTQDGDGYAERYVTVREDGLSFSLASYHDGDGNLEHDDVHAVPVRIYGIR